MDIPTKENTMKTRTITLTILLLAALAAPARADSVDDAIQQLQQAEQQGQQNAAPPPPPIMGDCARKTPDGDCDPHGSDKPTKLPVFLSIKRARWAIRDTFTKDLNGLGLHTRIGACNRFSRRRVHCRLRLQIRGSDCRALARTRMFSTGDVQVGIPGFRCRRR